MNRSLILTLNYIYYLDNPPWWAIYCYVWHIDDMVMSIASGFMKKNKNAC